MHTLHYHCPYRMGWLHSWQHLLMDMLMWYVYWLRLMQTSTRRTRYGVLVKYRHRLWWQCTVVSSYTQNGASALQLASQEGHVGVVSVLIEAKAHVNQQTKVLEPLHVENSHSGRFHSCQPSRFPGCPRIWLYQSRGPGNPLTFQGFRPLVVVRTLPMCMLLWMCNVL